MARDNNFDFIDNSDDFRKAMERSISRGIFKSANFVLNGVKKKLKGVRSGVPRKKPGRSVMYRPSIPGEAPATVEGTLRNSYDVRLEKGGESAQVGSSLDYALPLEKGTRYMRPRPHLFPVFSATAEEQQKIIEKEIAKEFKE